MSRIVHQLEYIRRCARALLVAQRTSLVVGVALAAVLVGAVVDYLVRFPAIPRMIGLGIASVTLSLALWRYVWPAFRFRPTLSDIAMRVERSSPPLQGYLTSALEFTLSSQAAKVGLAARMVEEADRRVEVGRLSKVLNPRRALISAGTTALITVSAATLLTVAPQESMIGIRRILMPWTSAAWPSLTEVVSETYDKVHPLGTAMTLRARVTRGFDANMRVEARYRQIGEDVPDVWQSVVLTAQADGVFERLIEPSGDAIEVLFATFDDETDVQRILLSEEPAVRVAVLETSPPEYASAVIPPRNEELGDGSGLGGAISGEVALQGSALSLTINLNKPIPVPQTTAEALEVLGMSSWRESAPDARVEYSDLSVLEDGTSESSVWRVRWTAEATTVLAPALHDRHGLTSSRESVFSISVAPDQPPTAVMVAPETDEAVLPSAVVEVEAEGRDDVAVTRVLLQATHFSRRTDSQSATSASPATENHERIEGNASSRQEIGAAIIAEKVLQTVDSASEIVRVESGVDVSSFSPQPGDVIEVRAIASDAFDLSGVRHTPVPSLPRRLTIISQAEFAESLLRDLGRMRESATRISSDQGTLTGLTDDAQNAEAIAPALREQARLGQRIDRMRESVQQMQSRIERNRFDHGDLLAKVERARSLVDQAGQASNAASESVARLAEGLSDQSVEDEKHAALRRMTSDAQGTVRDKLDELISLLSSDEDSWVIRRQIEKLLETQEGASEATREATGALRGRTQEELSATERRRLEDIARTQEELSRKADDVAQDMRETAQRLKESNPELARAMDEAARQAQQQRLSSRMQEAAEDVRENRGQRASEAQQSAEQTLARMRDRLERADRDRAQRLYRQLDSIVASLEVLVAAQNSEVQAASAAGADATALASSMIRLNANTLGVMEQINAAGPELRQVGRLVEEAVGAQADAVRILRDVSASLPDAAAAELRSLDRLTAALELARRLQEQMQQQDLQRIRQELLQAYERLQQQQVDVGRRTEPLNTGEVLDRRDQVTARRLGEDQDAVRSGVKDVLAGTEGLADALVFKAGHDRIDELAQLAVKDLGDGKVNAMTISRQLEIAETLGAFVEALRESQSRPGEFEQEGGGGAGGGGGSGGGRGGQEDQIVPPIAQIKLLRAMQNSLYRSTRALDEALVVPPADRREQAALLGQSQARLADLMRMLIEEMRQQQPDAPPKVDGSEPPRESERDGS